MDTGWAEGARVAARPLRRCRVLDLGLAPYGETLRRQEALVADRLVGRVPDTLILVEHPPVVTLGRAKAPTNLVLSPEALRARGIEFFEISRGGDATYHAPGQLVGYPIFDLRDHGRDVLRFCRGLEHSLIGALAEFGVEAAAVPGKAGVWVDRKKIASLGVSLRRWVTFHGFALNISTDLAGFQVIRPCGEEAGVMTSLAALLGRPVAVGEAKGRVLERLMRTFGFDEMAAVSP
ncbi:MAG: lipoyl(octanoyl) transferase LipB [Candidatus Methylomirabilota bacterium]